MPILLEEFDFASEQDKKDLATLYEQSDWQLAKMVLTTTPNHADQLKAQLQRAQQNFQLWFEWLEAQTSQSQLRLFAGRFNGRLVAALLCQPTLFHNDRLENSGLLQNNALYEILFFTVRKSSRQRGVGQQVRHRLQRQFQIQAVSSWLAHLPKQQSKPDFWPAWKKLWSINPVRTL